MSFINKHYGLFTSNKQTWTTPKELFEELNRKYHFTLDACADETNHLCKKYYTEQNSCLDHEWTNEIVFINPPYENIKDFIKKCYEEALWNNTKIVALVPARTDTTWFHNYIYGFRKIKIEFIKGRLKFGNSKTSAPFPSMLIYFNCNPRYELI